MSIIEENDVLFGSREEREQTYGNDIQVVRNRS